jgi:hypothetical protein
MGLLQSRDYRSFEIIDLWEPDEQRGRERARKEEEGRSFR